MDVRVRFLGKTLAVERASRSTEIDKTTQNEHRTGDGYAAAKEFGGASREGPYPGSEPIAERLGVDYPFPPHLEYDFSCLFLNNFFIFYLSLVDKWLIVIIAKCIS